MDLVSLHYRTDLCQILIDVDLDSEDSRFANPDHRTLCRYGFIEQGRIYFLPLLGSVNDADIVFILMTMFSKP